MSKKVRIFAEEYKVLGFDNADDVNRVNPNSTSLCFIDYWNNELRYSKISHSTDRATIMRMVIEAILDELHYWRILAKKDQNNFLDDSDSLSIGLTSALLSMDIDILDLISGKQPENKKLKEVSVLCTTFKLIFSRDPIISGTNNTCAGEIRFNKAEIALFAGNPASILTALVHEIIHAIIADLALRSFKDKNGKHNEHLVQSVAQGVAIFLLDLGVDPSKLFGGSTH